MKNPFSSGNKNETANFLTACGFFVFAVSALWVLFFVPMNMDEASPFHALSCIVYPFAPLHSFRESCMLQDGLTTPIGLHIPQPTWYTGLWSTILYAPFYFLLHTPGAQYLFGLVFLFAFAWLASRETAHPLLSFAVILSFFPFVYQFVHDTGPVKYAMLMFPLSAFFLDRILQKNTSLRYGYATVWALLLLGAVEEKPFFLYLLPSVILFALALAVKGKTVHDLSAILRKARGPLLTAGILTIIGILLLLFSVNMQGFYYIHWLLELSTRKLGPRDWFNAWADFMLYWPFFAHYTYDLSDNGTGAILFKLLTLDFLAFCAVMIVIMARRKAYSKLRLLLLTLSFASSAIIFLAIRNTWAGHHFVFLWAPLIVLIADLACGLTPALALGMAGSFFILNLGSVLALTQESVQPKNAGERKAIFHFFSDDARATQSIINFSSWGGYYIQALYGPENQLVTYTEPYDLDESSGIAIASEDAQRLLALSHRTGRTIYDACFGPQCNATALNAAFGNKLAFTEVLPGLQYWHVFMAKEPR